MVVSPFGSAAISREALRHNQICSASPPAGPLLIGGPPRGLEVVRGLSGRAKSGRDALQQGRK